VTLTIRQRDIAVSLGVFALGAFFLFQTNLIPARSSDDFSPDLIPRILSWLLIGFGILSAAIAILRPPRNASETVAFPVGSVLWVTGISVIGLAYLLLFVGFGYFVATAVTLAIVLFTFGVRNPLHIAATAVIGAAVYYLVFIRLMHVYDPAGSIHDFSWLLPF